MSPPCGLVSGESSAVMVRSGCQVSLFMGSNDIVTALLLVLIIAYVGSLQYAQDYHQVR